MRTFLFAVVLFAAGYGSVMFGQRSGVFEGNYRIFDVISQQAEALARKAKGLVRQPAEPVREEREPVVQKEAILSDYLDETRRAFTEMNSSCSEADRRRLGQAFYALVVYTKGIANQVSANGAGGFQASFKYNLTEFDIYIQVIDATRRGILRSRHFRPSAGNFAMRPASQRQMTGERPIFVKRSAINFNAAEVGRAAGRQFELTRCPPSAAEAGYAQK